MKDLLIQIKMEHAKIGSKYNTQCPECGFCAEGFDTEEEAAAWECPECQPTLPGIDIHGE
jgi:ribosomal protein L37AE/L43A